MAARVPAGAASCGGAPRRQDAKPSRRRAHTRTPQPARTGTRESEHPIHRYSGFCCSMRRLKKSGSFSSISAAHALCVATTTHPKVSTRHRFLKLGVRRRPGVDLQYTLRACQLPGGWLLAHTLLGTHPIKACEQALLQRQHEGCAAVRRAAPRSPPPQLPAGPQSTPVLLHERGKAVIVLLAGAAAAGRRRHGLWNGAAVRMRFACGQGG
jgi:hypothetical protein